MPIEVKRLYTYLQERQAKSAPEGYRINIEKGEFFE